MTGESSDGARVRRSPSDELLPLDEVDEPAAHVLADVVAVDRELDGRADRVELVADVVAPALEHVGVHRLLLREHVEGIGELDLAADAGLERLQHAENLGGEDVAS